jgi:hypothetical protein
LRSRLGSMASPGTGKPISLTTGYRHERSKNRSKILQPNLGDFTQHIKLIYKNLPLCSY